MNFLHTFIPHPILFDFGLIKIRWYGFIIVLGILAAIAISLKLARYYSFSNEVIIDSAFYAVIFGIIGARIYDDFLELPFYLAHPLNTIMIWQGGLAIHGGIIGGLLALYVYAKKKKIDLLKLLALFTPGLALAQALGRFGNYFNQELYGLPTNLPWGIPIEPAYRMPGFSGYQYFQPTFLYESLGTFAIFLFLILLHYLFLKNKTIVANLKTLSSEFILFSYLILYSLLRFFLEFIRIDFAPTFLGLRFPQFMSLFLIAVSLIVFFQKSLKIKHQSSS